MDSERSVGARCPSPLPGTERDSMRMDATARDVAVCTLGVRSRLPLRVGGNAYSTRQISWSPCPTDEIAEEGRQDRRSTFSRALAIPGNSSAGDFRLAGIVPDLGQSGPARARRGDHVHVRPGGGLRLGHEGPGDARDGSSAPGPSFPTKVNHTIFATHFPPPAPRWARTKGAARACASMSRSGCGRSPSSTAIIQKNQPGSRSPSCSTSPVSQRHAEDG